MDENAPRPVFQFHSNRYAEWRVRSGLVPVLRDTEELPTEKLLQAVWFHQRLQRERLRLRDGRALTVLHPGFWNAAAGPADGSRCGRPRRHR